MKLEPETEQLLTRARTGHELAFRELTDPVRRELELHCYRILGSLQGAEDMLQETLLAAWRGLDEFERRASLRTWLYRIATNRCLKLLRSKARRPAKEIPPMIESPPPTRRSEALWLQPYRDILLEGLPDSGPGPEARFETKEATALAFVAGLQRMPPPQRAALVLRDVLGYSAGESASIMETTEASVKGALQRARAAPAQQPIDSSRAPLPGSPQERELVGRFAEAFERGEQDTGHEQTPAPEQVGRPSSEQEQAAEGKRKGAQPTAGPARRSQGRLRSRAARRARSCRRGSP
jgi:RNA polymerase sigma-70 factor (TIGR02960 family)